MMTGDDISLSFYCQQDVEACVRRRIAADRVTHAMQVEGKWQVNRSQQTSS
jgi:hypothetical protein